MRRKEIINVTNAPWRWKINGPSNVHSRQSTIEQCREVVRDAHDQLPLRVKPTCVDLFTLV